MLSSLFFNIKKLHYTHFKITSDCLFPLSTIQLCLLKVTTWHVLSISYSKFYYIFLILSIPNFRFVKNI